MPHATVFAARRVITMDEERPPRWHSRWSGSVDLRGAGDLDETFSDRPVLHRGTCIPLLGATTPVVIAALPHASRLPEATGATRRRPGGSGLTCSGTPAGSGCHWWASAFHHGFFLNPRRPTHQGERRSMTGHAPRRRWWTSQPDTGWESGTNLLLPALAPMLMSAQRLTASLHQMVLPARQRCHCDQRAHHVATNRGAVPADPRCRRNPFTSTFLVDARSQADAGMNPPPLPTPSGRVHRKGAAAAQTGRCSPTGPSSSQLMQMREPYLDSSGQLRPCHHGCGSRTPRSPGPTGSPTGSCNIHVNGDAALDLVLDTVEGCQADHPRSDHRTVIVHFANSTEGADRPDRASGLHRLGEPVLPGRLRRSILRPARPGTRRADVMVRAASVLRRAIPLSLHSDLPMGPAAPLALASCAVNRRTPAARGRPGAAHHGARCATGGHHRGCFLLAVRGRGWAVSPRQERDLHGAGRGSLRGGTRTAGRDCSPGHRL